MIWAGVEIVDLQGTNNPGLSSGQRGFQKYEGIKLSHRVYGMSNLDECGQVISHIFEACLFNKTPLTESLAVQTLSDSSISDLVSHHSPVPALLDNE